MVVRLVVAIDVEESGFVVVGKVLEVEGSEIGVVDQGDERFVDGAKCHESFDREYA